MTLYQGLTQINALGYKSNTLNTEPMPKSRHYLLTTVCTIAIWLLCQVCGVTLTDGLSLTMGLVATFCAWASYMTDESHDNTGE